MADVRSLLRSELASRKGSSSQTGRAPNRVTKKRKVDSGEDLARKKLRHAHGDQLLASAQIVQPPSAQALEESEELVEQSEQEITGPEFPPESELVENMTPMSVQPSDTAAVTPDQPTEAAKQTVDEDEWAAFEREVVAPTRLPQGPAALAAKATILAAPISAEQLAAQQEKDNEVLAQTREAEAEGEREDAARFMEDELDEMDQLEERVRRLKDMREELRKKKTMGGADDHRLDVPVFASELQEDPTKNDNSDDDDDDGEEDDDWENWRIK
ncbi:hypothetical protein EYZ11_004595 [Aspergillus tanneri]|uniref:Uncharacterized protein n=1 Tax=Aspergillus tanneri TaxID=1220188 RepID=A0A4S3JK12_9EURO|nr:uncharacterized protein ATNIH1004_008710 [Aspergillus tanneri]KAA8644506.1 hypothetical protein ATNIH1004_008710 [Aspergillus tanneri]THC95909.1 hypothetical protein EYZ11_004595 [Aspergillus tanneri]